MLAKGLQLLAIVRAKRDGWVLDGEHYVRNGEKLTMSALVERYMPEPPKPVKRLVIVQESGYQCGPPGGRYEGHIHCFVPFDDEEFGKQECARLNRKTDLPYYLANVEVMIVGKMEMYDDERLRKENIEPLGE